MIPATTTFRSLVITSYFAGIVCMVIPLVERGAPSAVQILFLVSFSFLFLIWSIGLLCYKRWARLLCIVSIICVLVPIPGDSQSFSWVRRYFYDVSVFCSGAFIAMAFFSSVKDRFARRASVLDIRE